MLSGHDQSYNRNSIPDGERASGCCIANVDELNKSFGSQD